MEKMKIEDLHKYIQEEYGVEADYPFSNEWAPTPIFRHKDNRKWFAAAMFVPKCRVCTNSNEPVWILDVKCDPLLKTALLEKKGIYPAYHMNKEHWLTIMLDEVDEEDLEFVIGLSFDLTESKYKKRG